MLRNSVRWMAVWMVGTAASVALAQTPVGTAFTYQGSLKQSGQPADGSFTMEFRLFDSLSGGAQVGLTVGPFSVDVVGGLFTQALDFGASAFDADARWLEVTVGGTTLTPRQRVTASPFSLATRGIRVSDTGNVGIGAAPSDGRLQVTATQGPRLAYFERQGSTGLVTILGRDLTPDNPTAAGFELWEYGGPGPNAYIHLTGPGDVSRNDLAFVLGGERMRVARNGNVGIGTATPASRLTVEAGGTNTEFRLENSSPGGRAWGLLSSGAGAGMGPGHLRFNDFTAGADRMVIAPNGNVGIGTVSPGVPFHLFRAEQVPRVAIFETQASTGISVAGVGTAGQSNTAFIELAEHNGPTASLALTGGDDPSSGDLAIRAGNAERLRIANNGNVGIGTTDPQTTLHVVGTAQVDTLAFGDGTSMNTAASSGLWSPNGADIYSTNTGNVGIGTASPTNKISVAGTADISGRVGIGTSSPRRTLEMSAASPEIIMHNPGLPFDQRVWRIITGSQFVIQAMDDALQNAVRALTLTRAGYVGIGTDNPSDPLTVNGIASMTGFRLASGGPLPGQVLTCNNANGAGVWMSPAPPSGAAGGALAGTYPNPTLNTSAVGTPNIANGAVTDPKITSVSWSKVTGAPATFPPSGPAGGGLAGTYPNPSIAANAVGTAAIANNAVTDSKVVSVSWSKITGEPAAFPPNGPAGGDLAGTYPNPAIAASAVTSGELASDAASLSRVTAGTMLVSAGSIGIGLSPPNTTNQLWVNGSVGTKSELKVLNQQNADRAVVGLDFAGTGAGAMDFYSGAGKFNVGIGLFNGDTRQGCVFVLDRINGTTSKALMFVNASNQGVVQCDQIIKSSGTFRIDHPLDPEHMYLNHSFVESPDMKNIYDGVVTTDGDGVARVELPSYFDALNRDIRYQLTVIGQFCQAIVAEEVSDNAFVIQTDKPNVKVSWQVTGIRQDAYANAHRIIVEVPKVGDEQGRFIHPELFGAGDERSVGRVDREPSK